MTLATELRRQLTLVVFLVAQNALIVPRPGHDRRVLLGGEVADAAIQLKLRGMKLVDEELLGLRQTLDLSGGLGRFRLLTETNRDHQGQTGYTDGKLASQLC